MDKETEGISIKDIISKKRQKTKKVDSRLIIKAYNYAMEKFGNQKKKSGELYITEPLNVAYILADIGLDEQSICAALLYNVIEEDIEIKIDEDEIKKNFGEEIAEMVLGVNKLGNLQFSSVEERQVEEYRKMFLAMGKDIRVIIIKLADRLYNMRSLKYVKRDMQITNAKETMEIYAPLSNRLGLYSLKWEMEDLAFKYLYPEEYHELVEGINEKRDERLKFIEKIMEDIRVELKKQRIDAEVTGRAKHLYSIYRKMKRDDKTLDQIYDLFALRIIVKTVKDCYSALGVVHEMYTPMPGRFKDYIAVPKPNMYQSIHTTLLGESGTPFEVQIRTQEMHRVAEFGIAAHWAYKEASYFGKKQSVKVEEDKLAWLRESLEWQKDMQDPQEFLETLKTELFEDEVYVFTPKGKIIVLPRGATSIDFAYTIHQEVGNRMTGCKINSKMMPIITPLKTGDIVEVITSDNSKGPSRDWLKFVKSSTARNKIRSWFKKADKAENIEKGKDAIEKELKRIGYSHEDLFKDEYIKPVLNKYKYKNLEEMYAAIGFGAMSPVKIISRMLHEYRKEHEEENVEEKIEELTKKQSRVKPSSSGVIVKGIDNCLVKLSRCCNPVPGDEIVGYITKGRGVSVHRKDCINVKELLEEENRMIDVSWYNKQDETAYTVDIQIFATDRSGLLVDILKELGNVKAKLLGVNTKTSKESVASIEITIEVENLGKLNKTMKAIRKIESVYEVRRKK